MTVTPAELAARVLAAPPALGAVRLVVVDGPAGSGKSTLAGRVAAALGGAQVVHMDDLYEGWSGLDQAVWRRLLAWVLEPLAAGRAGRYRRYDWPAGRFAEWHQVPVADALVVEGVGAAAAPVDRYAALRVWVEAPADVRLARGIARDGEAMRDEWLRWTARETVHFERDGTRGRADVVLSGGG
ncbi:MAG: uridine kinase family protein [Actinomycetes bacterium]